jgi:hypothetical protein
MGLSAGALAQTASPAAPVSNDPIVQLRADQRAANAVYAAALIKAYAERGKKIQAAVESAVNNATENGKDPLVAKRDADAKARKATQADYDAALKKAADERKAALAAAQKKSKVAVK